MNTLEFSFEETPLEAWLDTLAAGDSVDAGHFLALAEDADEGDVEEILHTMEARDIRLDISDLPRPAGTGEAALRLRQEVQFVKNGLRLRDLEENDPLRVYLEEVAMTPATGDEQLLAEKAAVGDEGVMAMLTNLGLSRVIAIAGEYVGRGVLLLDLIQDGSLGLWQTIQDWNGGNYAAASERRIRFAMASAITLQARANGVGQKIRIALEDYRSVDQRLLAELGRNPTLDEIAESMHMTVSEIEAVRKFLENARMVGKAHAVKEPDEESPEDTQAVEDTAYYQTRERVDTLLSGISELEHRVVTMRYGLDGKAPQTAAEVGRRLNLTVSEVVELETAALTKMRQSGE